MARVHVLPPALASQIAAGEVVERPASAAKELIENALDAMATRCDVSCDGGGVTALSVRDDGVGMSEEDAVRAVERHATSKLSQISDLNHLTTFGFRGEALPSIASVCHFSLRTRARDSDHGCCVEVDCGRAPVVRREGLPVGTTVTVKDLFVNVPARRKFLRSTGTESAHVTAALEAAALSRHDVTFTLERDGRKVRELLRASTRRDRVLQLLPEETLVEVRGERGPLRFEAHLSRPERARAGTSGLWLLVNGRFVRDRMLAATVAQSYGAALSSGNYPRGVVYLDLPSELVDVNVHPQKTEVRFVDPRALADAVYAIVSRAVTTEFSLPPGNRGSRYGQAGRSEARSPLGLLPVERGTFPQRKQDPTRDDDNVRRNADGRNADHRKQIREAPQLVAEATNDGMVSPTLAPEPIRQTQPTWTSECEPAGEVATGTNGDTRPFTSTKRGEDGAEKSTLLPPPPGTSNASAKAPSSFDDPEEPAPATMVTPPSGPILGATSSPSNASPSGTPQAAARESGSLRFRSQVRRSFLVCEGPDALFVIDQHAAAERVAYAKLATQHRTKSIATQTLLFPAMIELVPQEVAHIEAHVETFRDFGLDVRVRGEDRVSVHSAPRLLDRAKPEQLVRDLLVALTAKGARDGSTPIEQAISLMACHGSLGANEDLTAPQAQSLLNALDQVEMTTRCTHGRPIVAVMRFADLERQAGRR